MPFEDFSIKRKLVRIIVLTSLSVLGLACLWLFTYEAYHYRQVTANSLSTIGDIAAENSTAVLIYDDKKAAEEILYGLRVDPEITKAALFDKQGRVYATYPKGPAASGFPVSPAADGVNFHLRNLVIYKPIMQENTRVGTLYLQGNFGVSYHQLLLYALVLLGIVGASSAAALILSNFFQRRISQPLLDLARTAHAISDNKDYSVRAKAISRDEIGDLTEAFNAMLEQIQANHSALREGEERFRIQAEEMRRARDEALAASRAKDDFLAALSHELRTPLNPVLLLASDAADNAEVPPDLRASFDIIRKNVELEARLIDDLLDLTRIARGKIVLDRRTVDVNAVLRDALATIEAEISAKPIALSLSLDPRNPVISGDPTRLQQVFWNVMKNAVKFTPADGKITVSSRIQDDRDSLIVEITDTGIGMTPVEMERIFEAFTQGDHASGGASHRFGGLGLGLAISRMVVELHSGRISASSQGRGHGSVFLIELPFDRAKKPAMPAIHLTPPAAPAIAAPEGCRARILLVEDHAPTRTTLEYLLRRRRYEVISAGSVAEARAAAARDAVDVLISDIGLPDGNGYDLMEELHARTGLVGIALTGFGMPADVARSREASFLQHLVKPIRIEMLEQALGAALAVASAKRNAPRD